jgi:hypothetical protein
MTSTWCLCRHFARFLFAYSPSKNNRLEVLLSGESGLTPLHVLNVFGKITSAGFFRPSVRTLCTRFSSLSLSLSLSRLHSFRARSRIFSTSSQRNSRSACSPTTVTQARSSQKSLAIFLVCSLCALELTHSQKIAATACQIHSSASASPCRQRASTRFRVKSAFS